MHRSHVASNPSSCPSLEYHLFHTSLKQPRVSSKLHSCSQVYTHSYIILLSSFLPLLLFKLSSCTTHSQLPSPLTIFLSLHFLCYESFYLLKQNPPIFRMPVFLPFIFRSTPMSPSVKSFFPCFPLEEQVKFIYYTEHCQAFNRMERQRMILVKCSQGIRYRNEAPKSGLYCKI